MKTRNRILLVDRNPRNVELMSQVLTKEGYSTIGASTLEEFDNSFNKSSEIGLAFVDIAGFDRTIWDRCERLRNEGIPFLVISSPRAPGVQEESYTRGARGILTKPLTTKQLLGLVKGLLGE